MNAGQNETMAKSGKGKLKFRILGCGSSPGVPRIGPDWGDCDPKNPKNRRRRASLLVERWSVNGTTRVVVDTGPDFREQMLDAGVGWADGVLFTHAHADHIHGIDDLRGFFINRKERVNVYTDAVTSERLHEAFDYCFKTPSGGSYPPVLNEHRIEIGELITINGPGGPIEAMPFAQIHGDITSLGFRFGGLAYSSDVSDIPTETLPYLENLDIWIVDALQYREHPSHLSLDQAKQWIDKVKPSHAILTHMHTPLDYETLRQQLPKNIEPAFDGMTFELDID